tara:strand:- start:101 stop:487 length:387 start_codon:yes stop_codon:yes gene_type:complete
MKERLTTLMKRYETDYTFEESLEIAKSKLENSMITGSKKNTWINEEGAEILKTALHVPEIVPKHWKGRVIRFAPNKSYVYCTLEGLDHVVPVIVPRRFREYMLGKTISIEEINDGNPSYRYIKEKLFD